MIVDTDHGFGWQGLRKNRGCRDSRRGYGKTSSVATRRSSWIPIWPRLEAEKSAVQQPSRYQPRKNPISASVPDPYWETIRVAMGRARTYAQKINLAAATPRNELSSTIYCLANPGEEYLIFNPGGPQVVHQSRWSAGSYEFEWFNPTTGAVAEKGSLKSTEGRRSFAAPFDGDAVLYLKRRN